MRNRNRRWLMAWTIASLFPHIMLYEIAEHESNRTSIKRNISELRGIFAPRMDYEHWTPLGRSDPLKNEPTYDYVPPVLEKVHYWIDPASRKPDVSPNETPKTEILILGMSSKRPNTVANSRIDTYDPFMKFVEGPKFGNQNQRMSRPYYHSTQYFPINNNFVNKNEQRVPYTMLMPPPLQQDEKILKTYQQLSSSSDGSSTQNPIVQTTSPITTTSSSSTTTESSVTVQYANLLYQSSSLGSPEEFKEKNRYNNPAASSQITWITPVASQTDRTIFTSGHQIRFPESYMEMQTFLSNSDKETNGNAQMHKGQVADDDLGIGNSYVNIGKSEAQMEIPNVSIRPSQFSLQQPPDMSTTNFMKPKPMTLQTLQTMQTMQPPPVMQPSSMAFSQPTHSIHTLLQKEVTNPITMSTSTISPVTTTIVTTETPIQTTTSSLTTDPLFKHYKQPSEPIKGPMYLIIQGHSKVKTYGPSKQIHGIMVQESNEIPTFDEKSPYNVKHLHNFNKKDNGIVRLRNGRSNNLQTLSHVVQTGLGSLDFSKKDVKETLLGFRYDVAGDVTTERYYKGVVESDKVDRNFRSSTARSRL